MLKCNECKNQISATARSCPHCGSKRQFVGCLFTRKELIEMGVKHTMDFYNYDVGGGKIKSKAKLYLKIALGLFIAYVVYMTVTAQG